MKKIITMLFFMTAFTTAAFAGTITDSSGNTAYEIIVRNSVLVDLYHEIYNIVAMIGQSVDYNNLLKVGMLLSAFFIFFKASVSNVKTAPIEIAKYLVVATAVLSVFYSHNSSMIVKTDNLMENYSYNGTIATTHSTGTVIGNIPTVYAYGTSLLHEARSELTDLTRKAFSTVNMYNNDIYATDITGATKILNLEMSELDGNLGTIFKSYLEDCINVPLSADSSVTADSFKYDLYNAEKIFDFLAANQEVELNKVQLKNHFMSLNGGTYSCGEIFTQLTTNEIPQAKASVPEVLNNVGKGAVSILTGVANPPISDYQELAIQAGAANMIRKSKNNLANDNALNYAEGKSLAQFTQAAQSTAHYIAEMLPVVEEILLLTLEAFILIMIFMLLLPNGFKAFGMYLKAMIWVITWTPMFYIVMFISNYLTGQSVAELNAPLTVATGDIYLSTSSKYAAVSAYLSALVPAISWGILSGSYQALGAVTGAMSSQMNAAMETGAGAKDRELLSKQKLTSQRVGKKLSLADLSAIEADQNSWNDSARIGAVHDLGQNKTMNKVELDTKSATEAAAKKIIAGGGIKGAVDYEAFAAEKDFKEKKGYADQTGFNSDNGLYVGQDKALHDDATAKNLKVNGAEKVGNVAINEKLEKTEAADTRFSEIAKTDKSVQEFAKNKAKVDFNTVENPRANALDMNGDGQTSDKELAKGAKVSDTQEKLDFFSKDRNQQELKKEAKDYKQSSSARIQNAMKDTPAALGELGQAAGAKIAADNETSTFNNRKETKKVENFKKENVAPEKLAATESAEEMQKVKKVDSEVKTLGNNLGGVVGQYSELRDNVTEDLMSKGMSRFEAQKMANRQMLGALAEKGLAVGELTEEVLTGEISAINSKEEAAFNDLIRNELGSNANRDRHLLKHAQTKLAEMEPGSKGAETWQKRVDTFKSGAEANEEKVEELINGEKGQAIANKFRNEREETVDQFGKLASYDSNGNINYLDTMSYVNNPATSQDDKTFAIKQIKGGLDGMAVSTNDLQGMERKWVQDINGNNTTDMSRAEQAYIKTGNFEYGVMYKAGQSDIVSKENLAIGATSLNYGAKIFGTRLVQDKLMGK